MTFKTKKLVAILTVFISFTTYSHDSSSYLSLERAYIKISNAIMLNENILAFWDISIKDVVGRPASNSKAVLSISTSKMNFSLNILRDLIQQYHNINIKHFPHRIILKKGSKTILSLRDAEKKVMNLCEKSFNNCKVIYSEANEAPFDSRGQILGLPYYKFAFINVLGKN